MKEILVTNELIALPDQIQALNDAKSQLNEIKEKGFFYYYDKAFEAEYERKKSQPYC